MSGYFVTDKSKIESIIPFGFRDMDEGARIYASTIKQGIFIKPHYGVTKMELDFESFYELYYEYLNSFDNDKVAVETKYNMNVRKDMWWPESEALLGSSVRIEGDMIVFDQLKRTDKPVHLANQYENIKKNPVGLDQFCEDNPILSPDMIEHDDESYFRHTDTISLRHTIPIDNSELGKFVNRNELSKIYKVVMKLSRV